MWHNRFRNVVNKHHPDLYLCLKEFQKEQVDVEIGLLEVAQGKSIKDAPKREWVESKMRLQRIVRTYVQKQEQGEVMQYLTTIANIVVLVWKIKFFEKKLVREIYFREKIHS